MPTSPFLAPERDDRTKVGRPKGGGTTYYTLPGVWYTSAGGLFQPVAGRDYYSPIYVQTPIVVDQLATYVDTAAAGNVRIGLYAATTDWQPTGAPLADSGDIDTSTTGLKTYTPGTPILLRRGRYLTVLNASSGTPVYRCFHGHVPGAFPIRTTDTGLLVTEFRVTRAYAAFPTPGTAWDTVTNGANFEQAIVLRILTP